MLIINRPTFLLDTISAPAAAGMSVRLLSKRMWGEPIFRQVRRGSDNAPRAIYHDREGNLDVADLLSWAGNSSVYVATATDPTGNGRDATQTTPTAQPMIVNAGALVMLGGRPTLSFDGTSSFLSGASFTSLPTLSINSVAKSNATGRVLWVLRQNGSSTTLFDDQGLSGFGFRARNDANTLQNFATGAPDANSNVFSSIYNGTGGTFYKNGVSIGNGSLSGSYTGPLTLWIGSFAGGGSSYYNGYILEFVVSTTPLATTDRQTFERNQGQYCGISVA